MDQGLYSYAVVHPQTPLVEVSVGRHERVKSSKATRGRQWQLVGCIGGCRMCAVIAGIIAFSGPGV